MGVTVTFSYIILDSFRTGKYEEYGKFTADIDDFRRWCKHYLKNRLQNGNPPRYLLEDVYCLVCEMSDGRAFIWQQHSNDKYGNKRGGWQKIAGIKPHYLQEHFADKAQLDSDPK